MKTISTARATSTASPAAFFARWIDHDSWSRWSPDSEWVRLDGPVALGTTGTLKPKSGPATKFVISALVPDSEYTDTSFLPGARLVFQHLVRRIGSVTELEVAVSMSGPLSGLWAAILGKGFRESTQSDLDRLVALVETADAKTEA